MMRELRNFIRRSEQGKVAIHSAVATAQTAPVAATAGAKLGVSHASGIVSIKAAAAVTLGDVTVWGRESAAEPWMFVGTLNAGSDIVIAAADRGHEERVALSEYRDVYVSFTIDAGTGAVTITYQGEELF
jgi:hypothetical protein